MSTSIRTGKRITGHGTLTNIWRCDSAEKHTHGWLVHLMRRTQRYTEFFSDSKLGGKRSALRVAQQRLKELKMELPSTTPRKNRMTRRNKTGKVGVTIAPMRVKGRNRPGLFFYVGGWVDKSGRSRRVYFSWDRYGKRNALALACLAREYETTDREFIIVQLRTRRAIR